jgi:hypothetical protein
MSICLWRYCFTEEILEIFAYWKDCEWDIFCSHDQKSGFVDQKPPWRW